MNRVRLHIWGGDYACFTRPEMKVERVSYDIIMPSAARGILLAVHWKPAILWVIDRIYVLKPIRFESVRRNELGSKISESKVSGEMRRKSVVDLYTMIDDDLQQRAATVLKDVDYVIEAHAVLTAKAGEDDTSTKHIEMFKRRASSFQSILPGWSITELSPNHACLKAKPTAILAGCCTILISTTAICRNFSVPKEMTRQRIAKGALWYIQTCHRVPVLFSDELRAQTLTVTVQVRELLAGGKTPSPVYGKRCKACSLVEVCQP
nr:type I-C CRISPR-associated protein Cas5c [Rodentibacter genomosp. 1]